MATAARVGADLTSISVPTLVLTGADPADRYEEAAATLLERVPVARRETIPDAGDGAHMDNPVEFNRAVRLFFHPGFVLELDHRSGRDVAAPSHQFARQVKSALSLATPTIWQHLYDGSHVVPEASIHLENLQVDYGESKQEVPATTSGIQVLLLYILVQQTVSSSNFIEGLRNHPQFSTEDIQSLAEFAVDGADSIVEYGLVGGPQWNVVLKDAYHKVLDLI